MTAHVENYVPVFKWELTARHQKQFGKAHLVYTFLKGLCNLKARPLRATTQLKVIAEGLGMDPDSAGRHLRRLKKYNYIEKHQTGSGIAFEIILRHDKYVEPASPDKPVVPEKPDTAKVSDHPDKSVGSDTAKLSDQNEETENATPEKQKGLQPSPDKTVVPLRLNQDSFKIKPDVGLLISFFQNTYFNAKGTCLPSKGLGDWIEEIQKYIPSPRLVRSAWLVFLHGWADDDWLADKPKTPKIFFGQVRNGKFADAATKFSDQRKQEGEALRASWQGRARGSVSAADIAKQHNPAAFKFWERVKGEIAPEVLTESFDRLLANTYPVDMNGSSITIAVPDQGVKNCLIDNYRGLIESKMQEVDESYRQVEFRKHVWGEE